MLKRKDRLTNQLLFILVLLVILAGLIVVNFQFANNNPGGNDFLAHYVGTRFLIFRGISPYSDQVALEIQNNVFGRAAQSGEIEHRVVYPIYSTLFFVPFALIGDYVLARVFWMTFLEIALLVTAYIALQLFEWKPKLMTLWIYFLFSIIWYHAFRSLINGNAVILVSLLIIGTLYAIKVGNDIAAGIMLAFSTIKPNLVLLLVIFILLWCIYKKRIHVVMGFFGSLLALTLGGMILIPNWIIQNIWEIMKYPAYNPAGSIGEVIGDWFPANQAIIKWGISGGLGLLLVYEWGRTRNKGINGFLWTACLTLVISQWIGIQTDPGNFIILFTPFVLILATWDGRWEKIGTVVVNAAMGVILFGLWLLFLATLNYDYQPMQSPVMFFPFPAVVLIGLYWIKWWVVRTDWLALDRAE